MKIATTYHCFGLLIAVSVLGGTSGCTSRSLMLNHDPSTLMRMPVGPARSAEDFRNGTYILQLEKDLTTAPTGAYLDEKLSFVEQSYLTPKIGYVLFEKIVTSLANQSAVVYRDYNVSPQRQRQTGQDATLVSVTIQDIEVHRLRTKQQEVYMLGRADLDYTVTFPSGQTVTGHARTQCRVPAAEDIFENMAYQFTQELYRTIMEVHGDAKS